MHYINCACEHQEHVIVMVVDTVSAEDKILGLNDSIILGYQLPRLPFWLRLKRGIGYILGRNPVSHWNGMILESDEAEKMISILKKVLD